jgi:hypothetical protein
MSTLQITTAKAVPMNVRMVRVGENYGRDNCLVHEDSLKLGPMVEFYDARYPHTEHGQFVSRYYAQTLFDYHKPDTGLMLDGGIPDWNVDPAAMQRVLDWVAGYRAGMQS